MQHNVEDPKLQSLESAWQQVDEASNSTLETALADVFNNIQSENIDCNSTEKEEEVEKDDIDGDEDGHATGGSWTEIEVRTIYTVFGQLSPEEKAKLQEFNDNEISLKVEEILRNPKDTKLEGFIRVLQAITTEDIDSIYDFEYDATTGEYRLVVQGEVDEEASEESSSNYGDSQDERRDPYGSRGMSQSDFR